MATISELRENEINYCYEHPEYFIDTYGHIEDKDADELIQPFRMWDAQREALKSILENKLNIILKARQLGITWLVLHIAFLMMLKPGSTVVALSRTEDEAKELVRRLVMMLRYCNALFQEKGHEEKGWKDAVFENTALEVTIHFPNKPDSIFKGFPSSANAGRSFTANLIIFDEMAFQQFAEEIYTAGFPTINRPGGGKVICLSTIDRGSFFETLFTDPDNKFNKIFIPWNADPKRDQAWYEETKLAMGDKMTQEYPATIEEALEVPGGAFFPEVKRASHIDAKEMTGLMRNYVCLDYGLDMLSVHWVHVNQKGEAQVYREYDAPNMTIGEAAAVILDLSEGEHITMYLAPPDLWNREQLSGKSRAIIFSECGLNLTKTSNDFEAGCASMKEWLKPKGVKAKLTFLDGAAPNLYRNLQKIQKDKRKPNVYAKKPHDLTHDCDSLRAFCVYYIKNPYIDRKKAMKSLHPSFLEDMEHANKEEKDYILRKYAHLEEDTEENYAD